MLIAAVALHLLAQPSMAPGRYDMGVRLQLVDQAWLVADDKAKAAAVPQLAAAVTGFFGGKPQEVCRSLDVARATLTGKSATPAWGQTFRPTKPIFEGEEIITFRGDWCYTEAGSPKEATNVPYAAKPKANRYGVAAISAGMPSGQTLNGTWTKDWAALKAKLEALSNPTAKNLAAKVLSIVDKPGLLSHSPALADWITTAFRIEEGELKSLKEIQRVRHDGTEFRIAFPPKTSPETDVMIALHGAGGEADMFFESYGAGIWRRRAIESGFIFASPDTSVKAPGAVLTWLESVRGIKPKRIYLVGHSMGGAAAISAAASMGQKPAAMVLLAPAAGSLPESLKSVPTLVCVGESEMMMIRNMASRLKAAAEGTPNGQYLTIPRAEHLMVVAESIKPSFDWLKSLSK